MSTATAEGRAKVGVEITLDQIYAQMQAFNKETSTQLQEAHRKLDTLTSEVRELRKDSDDYEARLRALERARWPLSSLAALVALASLVVAVVAAVQK